MSAEYVMAGGNENIIITSCYLHDVIDAKLFDDIEEYFNKNVTPYNQLAWMDRSKDKIGYEIPFTRIFYKFVEPKSSDEIFTEIKELELDETKLMKELFGHE